jgi:hypothetical protein
MTPELKFTFAEIESHYREVLASGYKILGCADYVKVKKDAAKEKILVNRVDIDFSMEKAKDLAAVFSRLKIKGTFFVRLHAPEYNPFSFENYAIL